ncbi:type I-G CRISPR-associated RAMP protein Csb1/Cas7g [Prescottella subtropica]|uniref:type I-G CRISPR-associated RAMP protein Csb1/Cas7g n=1 Tax=Prescottella subtropica TaxID=2545757 RepID=UPI001F4F4407|nr:type I-U CRISPR-associated RAMP protein Csb1/Cas7u [Prescottella subtropica]
MTTTPARTVWHFGLAPIAGDRFQPTGFPDLGAGEYRGADGTNRLAVESVQSLSNHLEGTTWDEARQEPTSPVASLPYVRVVDDAGEFLTSSRLEAHRLAGAYLLDGKLDGREFREVLAERFELVKGRPLNRRKVVEQIFALDPVSLLHGVFFAQKPWAWQPRVQRAVTAFIDADKVAPAVTGGVKKDSVYNESEEGRGSSEGYGMVPHHRTEYVADTITMHVVIDNQQIRSYGLSDAATELLVALAEWEIASLLAGGLRLRTACDLTVVDGSPVPDLAAATTRLEQAIGAASGELGEVTTVTWIPKKDKKGK